MMPPHPESHAYLCAMEDYHLYVNRECGAFMERSALVPQVSYYCTRQRGHEGNHWAEAPRLED